MFRKYVSNVPLGTGTNFILCFGETKRFRARVYLRPEMAGEFEWRLFYMNSVNTTFADGEIAWRNRSGGSWKILSARIGQGPVIDEKNLTLVPAEPEYVCAVTFDSKASREVEPDERLWSDPVRFRLEAGHYLFFEWELEGDEIPCTPDSQAAAFIDWGDGFTDPGEGGIPLPALFGCDRPYKKRVAFIGDSITQGCGTTKNAYEMWAGRIGLMLAEEYAVWNLGLGYARGADAATDGCWLWKAKQNDVVIVTCGTNDLLRGPYQLGRFATAGELVRNLEITVEALKKAGCEVILSIIPPFDYSEEAVYEWRAFNLAIPRIAELHGCRIYNVAGAIEGGDELKNIYPYGAHPDGRGGKVIADKFFETFHTDKGWSI